MKTYRVCCTQISHLTSLAITESQTATFALWTHSPLCRTSICSGAGHTSIFLSFFAPWVLCFDLCITHTDASFLVRQMLNMPEHALGNVPGKCTGSVIGNVPGRCQETHQRSHEHICNFFSLSLPSSSHHGDVLKSYTQL